MTPCPRILLIFVWECSLEFLSFLFCSAGSFPSQGCFFHPSWVGCAYLIGFQRHPENSLSWCFSEMVLIIPFNFTFGTLLSRAQEIALPFRNSKSYVKENMLAILRPTFCRCSRAQEPFPPKGKERRTWRCFTTVTDFSCGQELHKRFILSYPPPSPTSTSPVSTALIQIFSLEVKKKIKLRKTAESIFEIKRCSVERTWSLDAFVALLFFSRCPLLVLQSFLNGICWRIPVIRRHEEICLHNKMHVQFSSGNFAKVVLEK